MTISEMIELQNKISRIEQPVMNSINVLENMSALHAATEQYAFIQNMVNNIGLAANAPFLSQTANILQDLKGVSGALEQLNRSGIGNLTIYEIQNNIVSTLNNITSKGTFDLFESVGQISTLASNIAKTMEPYYSVMSSLQSQMENTTWKDYRRLFEDVCGKNLVDMVEEVYASMDYDEPNDETSELEADFTSNEEFQEAYTEQMENPIRFQERVANWAEKKKRKYYIAVSILTILCNIFIVPYLQENVGMPVMTRVVSKVRELPDKTGKVIETLKEDVQAVITGNEKYYYKVTFVDEDGNEREGYVAKRNLKAITDEE